MIACCRRGLMEYHNRQQRWYDGSEKVAVCSAADCPAIFFLEEQNKLLPGVKLMPPNHTFEKIDEPSMILGLTNGRSPQ